MNAENNTGFLPKRSDMHEKLTTTWLLCCLWALPVIAQQPIPSTPPLSIQFSREGGFYEQDLELELSCSDCTIFFTTNGDEPSPRDPAHRYRNPIPIYQTTVIRALALRGQEISEVYAHTYFIREPRTNFAVVSLSIPPATLFHPSNGLFVKGEHAVDSLWTLPGANFWTRKEVFANTEIYEADGRCVFRSGTGFRLFGGMSRLFPQKSIAIVARERYGENRIHYPIFGKKGLNKFKFLVLRNSGSDFGKSNFRDAFMTSLVEDWDLEQQDSRPSHVYINGQYWGIYNIREKINRYFIEGHHDEVDKDSIDLLEHRYTRKRGGRRNYLELLQYLETHDLSDDANYAYVQSLIEVENFIDFQIAQIYFDNQDAGGNIRYWRPQGPDGRWRWILYDTDWGFGLHEPEAYQHNSLAFHMMPDGPAWPNPPWSTFLFRKLLENPRFQRQFVTRFCDHLNTSLDRRTVEAKLDAFYQAYLPEMPRHLERWQLSQAYWESHVQRMRSFAQNRPEYVRMHLMEYFSVGNSRKLAVEVVGNGQVVLNDHLRISQDQPFNGLYFEGIPVTLTAAPELGYRFSHWEGDGMESELKDITLRLERGQTRLRAVFEPFDHPLAGKIMVNEVSGNNKASGDWIELYNYSDQSIQLKGWLLTDYKNTFHLPAIVLPPKEYLVICENKQHFARHFSAAHRVVGDLAFGLNKRRERIRLITPEGGLIDEVTYELPPMDSVFTLNLLLPYLDNADPENWEIVPGKGSPNEANAYYVLSSIEARRTLWIEIGIAASVVMVCIMLLILRQRGKL